MALTADELSFLRTAYGLDPSDASQDAYFNRALSNVPSDPGFYTDLNAQSKPIGMTPQDLLVILASESGYNTGKINGGPYIATSGPLAGHDTTPRGLPGFTYVVVPTLMNAAQWDALPTMTQRQQLPFVMKQMQIWTQRLQRPFINAFEMYLSNANPASLIPGPNPQYNPSTPMWTGQAWWNNPNMDVGPGGDSAGSYAIKHGETAQLNSNTREYMTQLAAKGVIKGYASIGDLQRFASRMIGKQASLPWKLASKRYADANGVSASVVPVSYSPASKTDASPVYTPNNPYEPDFSIPGASGGGSGIAGSPVMMTATGTIDFPIPGPFAIAATVGVLLGIVGLAYFHVRD